MSDESHSSFLTVETYKQFNKFVEAFAAGHIQTMLVIGEPGVSKSQTIRRAFHPKRMPCWIEGQASAVALYAKLYEFRDKPIVIDDVDALYANDSCRRLLKSLCQTDPVKTLQWNTQNAILAEMNVPNKFDTRSHVCIIANKWETLSSDVEAIEDRSIAIRFQPTPLEVHRQVAPWFWDQEVFDFLGSLLSYIAKPSMRHYLIAQRMKQSGFKDWRELVISRVAPKGIAGIVEIKENPKYTNEVQRVNAFKRHGLGSRATYFRAVKELPRKVKAPRLKCKGTAPVAPEPKTTKTTKTIKFPTSVRKNA